MPGDLTTTHPFEPERGPGHLVSPSQRQSVPPPLPVHHRSFLIALPACVQKLHPFASCEIAMKDGFLGGGVKV